MRRMVPSPSTYECCSQVRAGRLLRSTPVTSRTTDYLTPYCSLQRGLSRPCASAQLHEGEHLVSQALGACILPQLALLALRGGTYRASRVHSARTSRKLAHRHFPRKKKAAGPGRARSYPLAFSGLQQHGSRQPVLACAFAPHASGMPASDREDSGSILPFSSCGV